MAGVDEAGRGPLAGPVVAAAVILDELRPIRGLTDSKLLTPRASASGCSTRSAPRRCASASPQASVEEIDTLNILQATLLAMRRAVEGLRLQPQQGAGRRQPAAGAGDAGRSDRQRRRQGAGRSRPRRSWPRCTATGCACELHERASAVRLRRPQGLLDARAPERAARARRLPAAPAQLRAGARASSTGCSERAVAHGHADHVARQPAAGAAAQARRRPGALPQARRRLARGRAPVRGLRCARRRARAAGGRQRRRPGSEPRLRELAPRRPPRSRSSPRRLLAELGTLESPAPIGFVVPLRRRAPRSTRDAPTRRARPPAGRRQRRQHPAQRRGVRLHAGRSRSKGTAALWSPKVLRAGMGAHFGLHLVEGADEATRSPRSPCRCSRTSSHAGAAPRRRARCRGRAPGCSATKGRASSPALRQRCAATLRIPQPGGEESLNVAAAAAVCLYESARQHGR